MSIAGDPEEICQVTAKTPECAVAFSRFVRVRNRPLFGRDLTASEKRTVDGTAAIFRVVRSERGQTELSLRMLQSLFCEHAFGLRRIFEVTVIS